MGALEGGLQWLLPVAGGAVHQSTVCDIAADAADTPIERLGAVMASPGRGGPGDRRVTQASSTQLPDSANDEQPVHDTAGQRRRLEGHSAEPGNHKQPNASAYLKSEEPADKMRASQEGSTVVQSMREFWARFG